MKKKKKTNYEVVLVKWQDITGADTAWMTKAEAARMLPAVMTSIGVILEDNTELLVLASTWEEGEDLFSEVFVIPRAVVLSIKPFTP